MKDKRLFVEVYFPRGVRENEVYVWAWLRGLRIVQMWFWVPEGPIRWLWEGVQVKGVVVVK